MTPVDGWWYHALMNTRGWLVLLGGALVCCGDGRIGSTCREKRECEALNDADERACVSATENAAEVAGIYGCSKQFDAVLTCVDANATCEGVGDAKVFTTWDPDALEDRCAVEQQNYTDCVDGASAVND